MRVSEWSDLIAGKPGVIENQESYSTKIKINSIIL